MDLAHGYEGPPLEFPLDFIQTIVNVYQLFTLRHNNGFDDNDLLVFFNLHISIVGNDVVSSKA